MEFGAGSGVFTQELSRTLRGENPITAAVFSRELHRKACERSLPNTTFRWIQDLEELPEGQFDYIVGSMMLFQELLPETVELLYRLLKPGGQILFFERNWRHPLRMIGSRLRRWLGFGDQPDFAASRMRVAHVLSHQGFTHIDVAPYDMLPWWLGKSVLKGLQAKTFLLEHAPGLRWFAEGVYAFARKPGYVPRQFPDLAVHKPLHGAVSVVIPCYNEAPNIPAIADRLRALYNNYIHEILIVNDNSTDDTIAVTEKLSREDPRIRLVNRTKPNGVGRALRDGYRAATGEFTLSMDCDFIEILPEFRGLFEAVACGFDGAIGSRFSHESILVNYPFPKLASNRGFHALIKLFLVPGSRDLSNNLKLYRTGILRNLEIESPQFSANLETGLKPVLAGFNIREVPMSWINRTVGMGTSKFHMGKVGPDYARALLRIWRQHRRAHGRARFGLPEPGVWSTNKLTREVATK